MKTDHLQDTDPQWGALAPVAAGVMAVLALVSLVAFWAEQRLISVELPAQGTLLLDLNETSLMNAQPHELTVPVRLDLMVADQIEEGQDAVLRLRSTSATEPLELSAKVAEIIRTSSEVRAYIRPMTNELPKIEGLPLRHGSPVEVVILTGDRSVLALLLDPVIAVFSDTPQGNPADGT